MYLSVDQFGTFCNCNFTSYQMQVAALSGATTPTVNGQAMAVKVNKVDQVISVDIAKIVKADIKCLNGLIHVIDTVMMPK